MSAEDWVGVLGVLLIGDLLWLLFMGVTGIIGAIKGRFHWSVAMLALWLGAVNFRNYTIDSGYYAYFDWLSIVLFFGVPLWLNWRMPPLGARDAARFRGPEKWLVLILMVVAYFPPLLIGLVAGSFQPPQVDALTGLFILACVTSPWLIWMYLVRAASRATEVARNRFA